MGALSAEIQLELERPMKPLFLMKRKTEMPIKSGYLELNLKS